MILLSIVRQLEKLQNIFLTQSIKESGYSFVTYRRFCITTVANQWGKNKKHRNVKLNIYFDTMADPNAEEVLAPLRANVKEQVS